MDTNKTKDEGKDDEKETKEDSNLDPRIGFKLEELNKWTGKINALESHFEQSNTRFRNVLSESTDRLRLLAKQLGKSIDKSRPYYDARDKLIDIHAKCQKAAINYEKACSAYLEAKERIKLIERKFKYSSFINHNNNNKNNINDQHYNCKGGFDTTWQEMINQANIKLMEAESMKRESERFHQQLMKEFQSAKTIVFNLERKLSRNLKRSKIYFDEKRRFQHQLDLLKEDIELTVDQINCAKARYASTLKQLEAISEEIHEKRNSSLIVNTRREPGAGAESKHVKMEMKTQPNLNKTKTMVSDKRSKTLISNNNLRSSSQNQNRCSCNCDIHFENIMKLWNVNRTWQNVNFINDREVGRPNNGQYLDTFEPIYCNLTLQRNLKNEIK